MRATAKTSMCTMLALLAIAPAAHAADKGSGGAQYGSAASPTATVVPGTTTDPAAPVVPAQPTVPGITAKFIKKVAYAPALAPDSVKQAIWAANKIIGRPYVYGGGHASYRSAGYDCSGTVSYALHGGGLMTDGPLDSSSFMKWGDSGVGSWITIFTNPGHAYVIIAGIRLDTSAADDPSGGKGPRWRPLRSTNAGFHARHPDGL